MTYPANVYEKGQLLLQNLGTFWYRVFQDSHVLTQYYRGHGAEAGQTYQNYLEAVAALSRFDVPVFHKDNWRFITFLESDIGSVVPKYGSGIVYGGAYQYGVRYQTGSFSIPVEPTLKKARLLLNRILQPSLTWVEGIDYSLSEDTIVFKENPFENEYVAVRDIIDPDTGEVSDREAGLWIYNAEYDLQYLWEHFGYVLGVFMESSDYYKAFINAYWDCFVVCPSLWSLQNMLAALTGVPCVIEPVETVEDIVTTSGYTQVLTDKHVYKFSPTAYITVAAGDVLYGGDTMCDAVKVTEIISELPTFVDLPAMSFSTKFLSGGYRGELTFENKTVDLDYLGVDSGNKAIVRFQLSGFSGDVEKFWTDLHARGVAGGKVLADYLDTRVNKVGPPLPSNLPATVNPLLFVLENILRNNLFIIHLKPEAFSADAPSQEFFKYLRNIVPPQTTYVVYVETVMDTEYIDLTATPSLTTPGASDSEEPFDAPDAIEDEVYPVDEAGPDDAWMEEAALITQIVEASCDT